MKRKISRITRKGKRTDDPGAVVWLLTTENAVS